METQSTTTPTGANVAHIDRLIVACNDDARAQLAAGRVVGGARGARLHQMAARRAVFAHELADMVRSFGGRPETGTSTLETLRNAVNDLIRLVIGENPGDAYSSCARIEANAEKLYERGMRADLPAAMKEVVARQGAEIAADRAELRRSSMGG